MYVADNMLMMMMMYITYNNRPVLSLHSPSISSFILSTRSRLVCSLQTTKGYIQIISRRAASIALFFEAFIKALAV